VTGSVVYNGPVTYVLLRVMGGRRKDSKTYYNQLKASFAIG